MNYKLVSAALANKIALWELEGLAARIGVRLHPIMGMGSAPFRGGLSPSTAERVGCEYPSAVTFTIQSAFKYDYPYDETRAAISYLRTREIGAATPIDVERARLLIDRYSTVYRSQVVGIAGAVNRFARFIPARRARKLHVSLFGYARQLGGITLPRAISFTCALYSLGLPPELLGFSSLTDDDLDFLRHVYPSHDSKITDALKCCDAEGPLMTQELRRAIHRAGYNWTPHKEHLGIVRRITSEGMDGQNGQMSDLVLRAGLIRRFLG